jgi:hypothetical protein
MTRTDIHRESAVIPENYEHVMCYSLSTTQDGWPVPSFRVNCLLDRKDQGGQHSADGSCCVLGLRQSGAVFAEHGGTGQCTFCGARFVYGDIYRHTGTNEHVHVGHICGEKMELVMDNRDRKEFFAERDGAMTRAINAFRKAEAVKAAEFFATQNGLTEDFKMEHHIIQDIWFSLVKWGGLSDKQVALVRKIANDVRNPRVAEVEVAAPVGDARVKVEGELVSIKVTDGFYGVQYKMTVKVSTENGVWLCNGTLPSGIKVDTARGSKVSFFAVLKTGFKPSFAFFSRPTKAAVVSA